MFRNANFCNLGNLLQGNLQAERAWEWIFRAFEGRNLKVHL